MPSSSVRVLNEGLGFVDRIPTLPTEFAGFGLVKTLRECGVITDITFADLKWELEQKALNVSQLVSPANSCVARSNTDPSSNVSWSGLAILLVTKSSKGVCFAHYSQSL